LTRRVDGAVVLLAVLALGLRLEQPVKGMFKEGQRFRVLRRCIPACFI
jgi:hypothetical protein